MALWFLRGLRKGVVTTRYPQTVDPWARTLPTAPAFHPERLTVAVAERLAPDLPRRRDHTRGVGADHRSWALHRLRPLFRRGR